jgi:hypothetical protein
VKSRVNRARNLLKDDLGTTDFFEVIEARR